MSEGSVAARTTSAGSKQATKPRKLLKGGVPVTVGKVTQFKKGRQWGQRPDELIKELRSGVRDSGRGPTYEGSSARRALEPSGGRS